ncbi:hypothetical protein [Acetilactobacillus jinshanensis]|uniref:Uncharacterized protein n=1 Tax=Acetilactobacillus jinshanensis TaxID=1720083 RepID=A0A4P6ZLU7_9LACO|nr:hypothetical protein [Acetilactobacillus jinshanensis]QBP18210.1 hypothetical protein ELX58_03460 [Acetilactobacillus jinshanensis]URL61080.1 hypothetical protein HGK75_03535 [uncultured bacterium]
MNLSSDFLKDLFHSCFNGIEDQMDRNRQIKNNTVNKLIDFQNKIEFHNQKIHVYNKALQKSFEQDKRKFRKMIMYKIQSIKSRLVIYLSAWSINVDQDIGIVNNKVLKRCLGDLLAEEERILHKSLIHLLYRQ